MRASSIPRSPVTMSRLGFYDRFLIPRSLVTMSRLGFHDSFLIPHPVTMSRLGFYDSFFNTTFPTQHVEVRVL
jgi:hypothetical protein